MPLESLAMKYASPFLTKGKRYNTVVYRFNRISNLLVYELSGVVLIHLFMTMRKKMLL